jgi:hypothetical protein
MADPDQGGLAPATVAKNVQMFNTLMRAAVADDLEQSLRSPLPCPVAVKQLTTARHKFGDLSSGFEYVRDSQIVGSAQIGTAS